jgi:hypothetical protein
VTKTIGDNYKIYSLIIILNAGIIASVRCELFKMSNMSHINHAFTPRINVLMDEVKTYK